MNKQDSKRLAEIEKLMVEYWKVISYDAPSYTDGFVKHGKATDWLVTQLKLSNKRNAIYEKFVEHAYTASPAEKYELSKKAWFLHKEIEALDKDKPQLTGHDLYPYD